MKLEAASSKGFQELQERLEQDKLLNIQITAAVAGAWFVLASIVAALSGSGGNIGIVFLTALYHFGWGFFVIRHIFNYALPKVTRLDIFTKWLRDYWRWFLIGLIGVLFLYPLFWFGTIVSFILGSVATKRLTIKLAEEYLAGSRPMLFRWLQRGYSQKLSHRDQGIFWLSRNSRGGGLHVVFSLLAAR